MKKYLAILIVAIMVASTLGTLSISIAQSNNEPAQAVQYVSPSTSSGNSQVNYISPSASPAKSTTNNLAPPNSNVTPSGIYSVTSSSLPCASLVTYDPVYNIFYAVLANIGPIVKLYNGSGTPYPKVIYPGQICYIPSAIAVNPDNGTVYLGYSNSHSISVMLNATVTPMTMNNTGNATSIAVDSSSGLLYVGTSNTTTGYSVNVFNGSSGKMQGSIQLSSTMDNTSVSTSVVYDPFNKMVYASYTSANGNGMVAAINTTSQAIEQKIDMGSLTSGLSVDLYNGYLYAAHPFTGQVSVINGATNAVMQAISVGTGVNQSLFDPVNGYLYFTGNASKAFVVNGGTDRIIYSLTEDTQYLSMGAVDPFNGNALFIQPNGPSNSGQGNAQVVFLPTAPGTVAEQIVLSEIACCVPSITSNPQNGTIYSAIPSCGGPPAFKPTFQVFEMSAVQGKIVAASHNFNASVRCPIIYYAHQSNTLYANNGTAVLLINGTSLLPAGQINLGNPNARLLGLVYDQKDGSLLTYSTNSTSTVLYSINLTTDKATQHSFNFLLNGFEGITVDTQTGNLFANMISNTNITTIYTSNWTVGKAIVTNDTRFCGIVYVPLSNMLEVLQDGSGSWQNLTEYNATTMVLAKSFVLTGSTGSGSGIHFDAPTIDTINGRLYFLGVDTSNCSTNLSVVNSSTGEVLFNVSQGFSCCFEEYTYVQPLNAMLQTFCCSGTISFTQTYVPVRYGETFTETGLTSGTPWSVNLSNGQTFSSTTSSIAVQLLPGQYTYTIYTGDQNQYAYSNSPHNLNVGDSPEVNSVSFNQEYNVTFEEKNLPSGTGWKIDFNGSVVSTTQQLEVFHVTDGSYSFLKENTTSYYTTGLPGTVTVDGTNQVIQVSYEHYAYLNLSIAVLNATVTLNGNVVGTNVSSLNLSLPGGSYELVVSANGHNAYYRNFTLTNDQTKDLNVTLASSSGGSPINPALLYGSIGAVVVVIGGVSYFFYFRRPGK